MLIHIRLILLKITYLTVCKRNTLIGNTKLNDKLLWQFSHSSNPTESIFRIWNLFGFISKMSFCCLNFFKSVIYPLVQARYSHLWSTAVVSCNVWNLTSQSILRVRCLINLTECRVREYCTVSKLSVKYLRKICWFLISTWKFSRNFHACSGAHFTSYAMSTRSPSCRRNHLKPEDNISNIFIIFFLARQPPVGQGLLIHKVSRSHTTTHHSR